jgi:tRNA (cmo5U34)-methyltransferase
MDNQVNETNHPKLEKMSDFFTARLDIYEEHMLEHGDAGYRKFAELVPLNSRKLLDLGCGTGLELDWIFQRVPHVSVVGIDITPAMLDRLKQKHRDKNMKLICGSYFDIDLGEAVFDTAISFCTLHHFSHSAKVGLYRKIYKALLPKGIYIESDYMVTEQSQEDELYAENARLRREQNIPDGEFYHFDTPCTVDNQIAMLKLAGFLSVDFMFQDGNEVVLLARK